MNYIKTGIWISPTLPVDESYYMVIGTTMKQFQVHYRNGINLVGGSRPIHFTWTFNEDQLKQQLGIFL